MDSEIEGAIRAFAETVPGLKLLVLYGSRARGDALPASDWDIGYLADPAFDPDSLFVQLSRTLGSDRIDLVDLSRAGGLLRYRAAAEGRALYEAGDGLFPRFWMDAVTFWCDMGPIFQKGYEEALERFPR